MALTRRAAPLVALAVLVALSGCGRAGRHPAAGDSTHTLRAGGLERTYVLHVPEQRSGRLGLIVALHGGVSTPAQFEAVTGFDEPAARDGLAVAYPEGYRRTWNAGDCCGVAMRQNVDDVAFIRALIADVARRIPLDRGRVFASGWSNGGKMAYRLACQLSDRIAAIGVVGTGLGVSHCAPRRPVSILHLHGTADRLHPYDGGVGEFGQEQVGAPQTIAVWRRLDRCSGAGRVVYDHGPAQCRRWSPCRGGSAVELCTIDGMGHQWPGRQVRPVALLGPGTDALDATPAILAFFKEHGRSG